MALLKKGLSCLLSVAFLMSCTFLANPVSKAQAADTEDLDYVLYQPTMDPGPASWGWTALKWKAADSGIGETMTFSVGCCFMRQTLNYGRPVKMDGLHVEFRNSGTDRFGYYAILLSNDTIPDFSGNIGPFTFKLYVDDTNTNLYLETSSGELKLAESTDASHAMCAAMNTGSWDFSLHANSDGSYALSFAGSDFTIPKANVDDALAAGLDLSSVYVSIGGFNRWESQIGGDHWQFDVTAIHGGESTCYSQVSTDNANKIENAKSAIDAIGTVTAASGDKIAVASSAFDAVPAEYQALVTNSDVLTKAKSDYQNLQLEDLDYETYVPTLDPQPASYGWTALTWKDAVSGKGTTLTFSPGCCFMRETVNYGRPINADGLHMEFRNSGTDRFGYYLILLSNDSMPDFSSNLGPFTFKLYVDGTNTNLYLETSSGELKLAESTNDSHTMCAVMNTGSWDMSMHANTDGSYALNFAGVDFTIPKANIDDAVAAKLDFSKVLVTIGGYNRWESSIGGDHWQFDIASIHGGESHCYAQTPKGVADDAAAAKTAIDAIGTVTKDSGDLINVASAAVDKVPADYQGLIPNLKALSDAEAAYQKLKSDSTDMDPYVYAPSLDPTPNDWNWTPFTWKKADSGFGETINVSKGSTYMRMTFNYQRPLKIDGLHVKFANSSQDRNGQYVFMLSNDSEPDFNNPVLTKYPFYFMIWTDSGNTNITLHTSSGDLQLAYGNAATAHMAQVMNTGLFEMKLNSNQDGSYTLYFAGESFTIPKAKIDDAVADKLDFDSAYFTIGSYNPSETATSYNHWQFDLVSVHGGESPCYSDVPTADASQAIQVLKNIDAIGTVTKDSGSVIKTARDSYNKLDSDMQKLVSDSGSLKVLEADEAAYQVIAADVSKVQNVIDLINKIPGKVELNNTCKQAIIVALAAYEDLAPSLQGNVTNYDKLQAARKAYEALDPNADFDAWALAYSQSKGTDSTGPTGDDSSSSSQDTDSTGNTDTGTSETGASSAAGNVNTGTNGMSPWAVVVLASVSGLAVIYQRRKMRQK